MHALDDSRLTVVVTRGRHRWNGANAIFADSLRAIDGASAAHDVERIIIDRCATSDEFLYLLAALPNALAGDVICIRNDGGAFLSATGRGGDRVLYALAPHDLHFYLETHGLAANLEQLALSA